VSRLLLTTVKIDPKRAIPREEQERTSKIFVGGVSQEATEEDFTKFFKQFGRVVDATLMMDKETGRPRGFGFVTFDGDAAVDATLRQPLQILGKPIEVKRAQPRGNMRDDDGGDKKFGRNNKFNNRDQGGNGNAGGYDNQMNSQPQGGNGNMTPAMMAQYWQRMQQYFQQMQQNLAQQQVGGGGMAGGMGPMGGMGGMNPMQMQQMQQQMMGGGMNRNTGSPNPQNMMGNPGGMNPMQMQQMMQANAGANPGSFAPNQGTFTPPSPPTLH
jgi:RNA-binding protein Musashi